MKTVGFSDILQQNTVIWDFTFLSFKWLQKTNKRENWQNHCHLSQPNPSIQGF